jgi:hypothetical protein
MGLFGAGEDLGFGSKRCESHGMGKDGLQLSFQVEFFPPALYLSPVNSFIQSAPSVRDLPLLSWFGKHPSVAVIFQKKKNSLLFSLRLKMGASIRTQCARSAIIVITDLLGCFLVLVFFLSDSLEITSQGKKF